MVPTEGATLWQLLHAGSLSYGTSDEHAGYGLTRAMEADTKRARGSSPSRYAAPLDPRRYRPVITAIPATNITDPITTSRVIFSSPRKNIAVNTIMNSGVVLRIGLTTETSPAWSA